MSIGFRIERSMYGSSLKLLNELELPLSNKTIAHHYNITTTGELLEFPQLVADLASHPSLFAVLINEKDSIS